MIWRIGLLITIIGNFAYCAVTAIAQSVMNSYTCTTTSVSSATTPTIIMSPGLMTWFNIHVEASPAADPVKVFAYSGTPPTAVPSPEAAMERTSGSDFTDTVACNAPSCRNAIGRGWMGYLEGGSTATKVDACNR